MRIADVSRLTGFSASYIRQKERAGVLPASRRDINGQRRYVESDVEEIRRRLAQRPAARTRRVTNGQ